MSVLAKPSYQIAKSNDTQTKAARATMKWLYERFGMKVPREYIGIAGHG